jgi:hypothetical protein
MNFARPAVLILLAAVVPTRESIGCSCTPTPDVATAFADASAVFLAQVESTTHSPTPGDTTGRYVTETATFVVLEAWKGAKRPRDKVQIRSELGPYVAEVPRTILCGWKR